MSDTAPVSHALIEFRSDRLGEFVVEECPQLERGAMSRAQANAA